MRERAVSAFGMLVMMTLAFALCPRDRRRLVRMRTVGVGLLMLLGFALIVLRTPANIVFEWGNDAVDRLLSFSRDGASFVFGRLATDPQSFGMIFAFQVLPTILFFSALMSVLYHVRLMPIVIEGLGRFLSRVLGTTGAESFSTVADVFVGQTEAPLVIRPYLAKMSVSELNACMVAGFATTAGGVLAAYVAMLGHLVPGIAGHLIACSVMSAPASLVIAKLMLPEKELTGVEREASVNIPASSENLLDAIAQGTGDGIRLAVNVGGMLIVFLALTAMVNAALGYVGSHVFGRPVSLELLFGWAFAPLAWVMGVPSSDVRKVAELLGQKTVLNEFVAYSHMAEMLAKDPHWLTERGRVITAYALCGFANFGSIGIQIGGYSGLAPERRADISRLALRAMIGGLLATCLVACVAGVML
ncbi:MAG TPA: nucleoside transporter C-terminal domain-containing protein [Polyangiaceae bacterium]|jgi:CNT family concentrative nucleoside transporter|nr:nucleoside transporter C-terminal domain-containing protein [Polyangiaceae bacterium]